MARKERKVAPGYAGFKFDTSRDVTLEEDLMRRDLTINAIAQTPDGKIIDPYHGKEDLDRKLLRHVSDAFVEDPVRILRVARFAARFHELRFETAPETKVLMKKMVESGEINSLVAERVWKELERALSEKHPECFFAVLDECAALPALFPNFKLDDPGIKALKCAVQTNLDVQERFAVLLHETTVDEINTLCNRYRVPVDYRELALLVVKYIKTYEDARILNPEQLVKFLQAVDAYRREVRFEKFLKACKICAIHDSNDFLLTCLQESKRIDAKTIATELQGKEIAERITQERIKKVEELIRKLKV